MKKSIIVLAAASVMVGNVFLSCKSNSEKESDAVEKVQDAKENLDDVTEDINEDTISKANDAEWQTYKSEAIKTITANETRIAELKKAINKPGTTFDKAYVKSIASLEDKNASLKIKITNYENNQTDWDSFKREFNSDMNELGTAIKEVTTKNKK
jgi:DNA polymerase II small subunit/DNA polymerase delta subunit B